MTRGLAIPLRALPVLVAAAVLLAAACADRVRRAPSGATFETDLNTASHGDLTELPGITDSLARVIAAHRPYRSKSDLLKRGILTRPQYAKVERLMFAHPPKSAQKSPE